MSQVVAWMCRQHSVYPKEVMPWLVLLLKLTVCTLSVVSWEPASAMPSKRAGSTHSTAKVWRFISDPKKRPSKCALPRRPHCEEKREKRRSKVSREGKEKEVQDRCQRCVQGLAQKGEHGDINMARCTLTLQQGVKTHPYDQTLDMLQVGSDSLSQWSLRKCVNRASSVLFLIKSEESIHRSMRLW